MQANPLQGNPALAAAIAAYNINDPTLGNNTPRAVQSNAPAVGRVTAVTAADRARGIGA
ncbi:hypothetical protein DUPY_02090 [Duganella phyllosphaerae]|uniref:Uncharacterized protein n=3 Tax=Duganella TaxID=75654 RepID=A0A1E7X7W9_9BURK|nr:hypothetical protein DUPY_02090 [Duganella phyllosphaerae]